MKKKIIVKPTICN